MASTEWGDLFNPRQLLSLCTFGKWVREAYRQILRESGDAEFAKAVATYLALAVDRLTDYNCSSVQVGTTARETSATLFSRASLAYDLGLRGN
jgi:putative DNA methylase